MKHQLITESNPVSDDMWDDLHTHLVFTMEEEEIRNGNMTRVFQMFSELNKQRAKARGKCNIVYTGEMCVDKEACNYMVTLYQKYKNLFYFIIDDDMIKTNLFFSIYNALTDEINMEQLKKEIVIETIRYGMAIDDPGGAKVSYNFLKFISEKSMKNLSLSNS